MPNKFACFIIFMSICVSPVSANPENSGRQLDPPMDLTFETGGSANLFTAEKGSVAPRMGELEFTFQQGGAMTSPALGGSRNLIYNPTLSKRNTFFFVMENRSSADKVKISFISDVDGTYDDAKSKVFDITPNSPKQAYYFNLSDNPNMKGRLAGFRVEPIGGAGKLLIDRITFERERVIEPFAGEIISCNADRKQITVKGRISPEYAAEYDKIAIYETLMAQGEDDIAKMTKLYEGELEQEFTIDKIPMMNGSMTRLSSQFLAVAKNSDADYLKIAPRFYIGNWADFEDNPYAFTLQDLTVYVTDYGAAGNGFTDDTDAIQAAIDDVSAKGGGKVVLAGDDSFYGKRYIATNILMRDNVELNIAENAILWQSQDERDYKYKPAYGHESNMTHIPWSHNMHVSNLPLIQAKSVRNIKVTGPGQIRSLDVESEDEQWGAGSYPRYCNDRIHVIPFGFWDVENLEVSNVDLVRTNNYHGSFYACANMFFGNIKMYEVACVSGDGIGLGVGSHNTKIARVFLESNDDGVTLVAGYDDPRGVLWWWAKPDADNSVRNVVVCSSYISSGGGKAIAFIPWGKSNPRLWMSETDGIFVYDCVLNGGYSVGTWNDDPFGGKMPFDNTETDDYSPVKNVRMHNNLYLSKCDLLTVQPTNFISDCGIHSAGTFQNGDFGDAYAYWTVEGDAGAEVGEGYVSGGRLYEGLYLEKGSYTFTADVISAGAMFVENAVTNKRAARSPFDNGEWTKHSLTFNIGKDDTYYLGFTGKDVRIKNVTLIRK